MIKILNSKKDKKGEVDNKYEDDRFIINYISNYVSTSKLNITIKRQRLWD